MSMLTSLKKCQVLFVVALAFFALLGASCNRAIVHPEPTVSRSRVDLPSSLEASIGKQKGAHPKTAGISAFFDVMASGDQTFSGEEILEAIRHLNPEFPKKNAEIYRKLGEINEVFSKDGKLYITFKKDKAFEVDKMKIRSGSRFSKPVFASNQVKLNTEEGVSVGWGFVQFDLNYLLLDQNLGELVVNYGSNKKESIKMEELFN